MKKDYYQVLGLEKSATQQEIINSFLNLMKTHPSHIVVKAYEVLMNPFLRKQYDPTYCNQDENLQIELEKSFPIVLRKYVYYYRSKIYDLNKICEFDTSNLFLFENILEFILIEMEPFENGIKKELVK